MSLGLIVGSCYVGVILCALVARWQRRRTGNWDGAMLWLLIAFVLWVIAGIALVGLAIDYTSNP